MGFHIQHTLALASTTCRKPILHSVSWELIQDFSTDSQNRAEGRGGVTGDGGAVTLVAKKSIVKMKSVPVQALIMHPSSPTLSFVPSTGIILYAFICLKSH
jgi:hypothetical protein